MTDDVMGDDVGLILWRVKFARATCDLFVSRVIVLGFMLLV